MVNTGTWNSDMALLFVLCFFAPIVLFFLAGTMAKIADICCHSYVLNVYQSSPQPVKPVKPVQPRAPVVRPKTIKPPPRPPSVNIDNVISDAASGLVRLGLKRSDARRMAAKIQVSKDFKKPEYIVRYALDNKFRI